MRALAMGLLRCVLALAGLYLLVFALQCGEMICAERTVRGMSEHAFCPRGGRVVSCDPRMVRVGFSARKGPRTFRVFVVGSSQAMGSPYVFQELNAISRFFPNEGGLSTWLEDYLAAAHPDRQVEVINAAKGMGAQMADQLQTFRDIVRLGSPDLIVVLDGNNEKPPEVDGIRLRPGADLDAAVSALGRNFQAVLAEMARLAQEARVPLYLLTVPNNLRDWTPAAASDPGLEAVRSLIAQGRAEEALRRLDARADRSNALHEFSRAQCLDAAGRFAEARRAYVRAKDRDENFGRTRSAWNELIRRQTGATVRVIDLESLLSRYARDGIPGQDLFHDYCHMKLLANKFAAYEIARFHVQDQGLDPALAKRLQTLRLRAASKTSLRILYWLKIVKWTQYYLLPARLRGLGENTGRMISGYSGALGEIQAINDQIELFKLAEVPPRAPESRRDPGP